MRDSEERQRGCANTTPYSTIDGAAVIILARQISDDGVERFQPISVRSVITPCRRTHEETIGEKQRSNRGRSLRADIIVASKALLEGCLTRLGKMLSKPCAQQAPNGFQPQSSYCHAMLAPPQAFPSRPNIIV